VKQETDLEPLFFQLPRHLAGLLVDPDCIGMYGAASKVDAPTPYLDEEKNIDRSQKQGFDGKEIASQDLVFIMGHQAPPTRRTPAFWRWWDAMSSQNIAHCLISDFISQLPTLTFDATIAPVTVLSGQLDDQSLQFSVCSRSASPVLMTIGPFTSGQLPMPFEDRFRLEDTDDVTQLPGRSVGGQLQPAGQDDQRQLFGS
jgi:hypothetical protein